MISRRTFLAALAALPCVGRFVKVSAPKEVRGNGMRIRFVDKWEPVKSEIGNRWDGYMCEDGQIRFMLSRDGGQTWEQNGAPVNRDDLPRIASL